MAVLLMFCGCATPSSSFFAGSWSGESQFASGQKTKLVWTVKSCGADCLSGESAAEALKISAKDQWRREGDQFARDYSDSEGTKGTLHSSGWKDGVWIWEGEIIGGDGSKLMLRETITRLDARTFRAKYESREGDAWVPVSEETMKRDD
ncbi:MAG: hypothetical protein QM817_26800 [Archangium sp.]